MVFTAPLSLARCQLPRYLPCRFPAMKGCFCLVLFLASSPLAHGLEATTAFPRLPITVRLVTSQPADGRDLCDPSLLRPVLAARTFALVFSEGRNNRGRGHDLGVACAPLGGDRIQITVEQEGVQEPLYQFDIAQEASYGDRSLFAEIVAEQLAQSPSVIEGALAARMETNRLVMPELSVAALRSRKLSKAIDHLLASLHGDPERGDVYYMLYVTYKRNGMPRQALWYLLAYLHLVESSIRAGQLPPHAPVDLDLIRDQYLALGRDIEERPAGPESKAANLMAEWESASATAQWDRAIASLEALVRIAPWHASAYRALGGVYKALRWDAFSESWDRRGRLVVRVNDPTKSRELIEEIFRDQ